MTVRYAKQALFMQAIHTVKLGSLNIEQVDIVIPLSCGQGHNKL